MYGRDTQRVIQVLPEQSVQIADINILSGCIGDVIKVNFADYNEGEKVVISGLANEDQIYETSSFNLALTEAGIQTIEIISVRKNNCETQITNESVNIETFAPVEILSVNRICDELGSKYTLEVEISGGNLNDPIEFEGPDFINPTFAGNLVFVRDLDPSKSYTFKFNRGILCDDFELQLEPFSCECVFDVGSAIDTFFIGCQGEFFDLTDVFSTSDGFTSVTDTAILVLHDIEDEASLGNVVAVFPFGTEFITNSFENFISSNQYYLSLVGIRKFELPKIDLSDYPSLSLKGAEECLSIVKGVPVKWHGSKINISGPTIVCENAYNEIFISSGIGDGADLKVDILGLSKDNYTFDVANNRLYVHFVNEDQDVVPINISASSFHVDSVGGKRIETECNSTIEYIVQIDRSHIAPDTSAVILWPGNIFASTDTLDGICYRWGRTITNADGFEEEYFENGDERFYYASEDQVDGISERRQIWVETYFCDDNVCGTRNIFNGNFPIGSIEGELSDSDIIISPNPFFGEKNLKIQNYYYGEVDLTVYDILGRQFYKDNWVKNGFIANKNLNLSTIPKGIYFVKIDLGLAFSKTIKISKF